MVAVSGSGARSRDRGYWNEGWHRLLRDRVALVGLAIVVILILAAVLAPLLAPYDPNYQQSLGLSPDGRPMPPAPPFWLGTDTLGRDELSRLLYGARVSLAVGIVSNAIGVLLGLATGGVAGMATNRWQTLIMRFVDVLLSFPILLVAIVLLAITSPNILTIILLIGIASGAFLSRIVFAQTVSLRQREFVLAAEISGVPAGWILIRHVVPHVIPSVLVFVALGIATAIQLEATLSYVGIGIQLPQASWGNMISEGQAAMGSAPWLVAGPGLAIVLAMTGFSLLGDGLRDALDPTIEQQSSLMRFRGVR